ncbi:MAG: HDOD domain-containing protein [Deltaproteobacteria bacterium]|nr:HDOD domain-containing protein [Deltaproteobacteria bacterium]
MSNDALDGMELPALPDNARKVLSLLFGPDVSVEKVKRLISCDGPLAAKILNIANYDFYGGGLTPPTLSDAIMRLGFNAVRNIVVAASIKGLFKRLGDDEQAIWRGMMGSAIASSIIARHTKLSDVEDAFIGGLLHDAGSAAIVNGFPDAYRRTLDRARKEGISFSDACKEEFGFTHREVGAAMVRRWGFPDVFESLILYFDDPEIILKERYIYNLVSIVALADRMCLRLGISAPMRAGADVTFGTLGETLGIDDNGIARILENVKVAFDRGLPLY